MKSHVRSILRVISNVIGEPEDGVEIGVWKGGTSRILLEKCPRLFLSMVDAWSSGIDNATMNKGDLKRMEHAKEEATTCTLFAGSRRTIFEMKSDQAAHQISDSVLDFAFIDACHSYETVKLDLESWFPKVRPGGVMIGHDYNGMGDKRKGWGVKKAVDEFALGIGKTVNTEPGLIWWFAK